MINLLPPIEKEFLKQEETKRLLAILGVVFLAFLICLVLILLFIGIYISSQAELKEIETLAKEKEFKQSESQVFQEKIILANSTFSQLSSFYQKNPNFSQIIEEISKTLPEGVYLTNLSFVFDLSTETKNPGIQVSLSGFSPTREILFEFKKNLEKNPGFKEVYFPPTNWIKPLNVDFNLSLQWNPSL